MSPDSTLSDRISSSVLGDDHSARLGDTSGDMSGTTSHDAPAAVNNTPASDFLARLEADKAKRAAAEAERTRRLDALLNAADSDSDDELAPPWDRKAPVTPAAAASTSIHSSQHVDSGAIVTPADYTRRSGRESRAPAMAPTLIMPKKSNPLSAGRKSAEKYSIEWLVNEKKKQKQKEQKSGSRAEVEESMRELEQMLNVAPIDEEDDEQPQGELEASSAATTTIDQKQNTIAAAISSEVIPASFVFQSLDDADLGLSDDSCSDTEDESDNASPSASGRKAVSARATTPVYQNDTQEEMAAFRAIADHAVALDSPERQASQEESKKSKKSKSEETAAVFKILEDDRELIRKQRRGGRNATDIPATGLRFWRKGRIALYSPSTPSLESDNRSGRALRVLTRAASNPSRLAALLRSGALNSEALPLPSGSRQALMSWLIELAVHSGDELASAAGTILQDHFDAMAWESRSSVRPANRMTSNALLSAVVKPFIQLGAHESTLPPSITASDSSKFEPPSKVTRRMRVLAQQADDKSSSKSWLHLKERDLRTMRLLRLFKALSSAALLSKEDLQALFLLVLKLTLVTALDAAEDAEARNLALHCKKTLEHLMDNMPAQNWDVDDAKLWTSLLDSLNEAGTTPAAYAWMLQYFPSHTSRARSGRMWLAMRCLTDLSVKAGLNVAVDGECSIVNCSYTPVIPSIESLTALIQGATSAAPFKVTSTTDYAQLGASASLVSFMFSDVALQLCEPDAVRWDDLLPSEQRHASITAAKSQAAAAAPAKGPVRIAARAVGSTPMSFLKALSVYYGSRYTVSAKPSRPRVKAIEKLILALKYVNSRVQETRGAQISRSRAKDILQRLELRLHHELNTYGKNVRGEQSDIRDMFVQKADRAHISEVPVATTEDSSRNEDGKDTTARVEPNETSTQPDKAQDPEELPRVASDGVTNSSTLAAQAGADLSYVTAADVSSLPAENTASPSKPRAVATAVAAAAHVASSPPGAESFYSAPNSSPLASRSTRLPMPSSPQPHQTGAVSSANSGNPISSPSPSRRTGATFQPTLGGSPFRRTGSSSNAFGRSPQRRGGLFGIGGSPSRAASVPVAPSPSAGPGSTATRTIPPIAPRPAERRPQPYRAPSSQDVELPATPSVSASQSQSQSQSSAGTTRSGSTSTLAPTSTPRSRPLLVDERKRKRSANAPAPISNKKQPSIEQFFLRKSSK